MDLKKIFLKEACPTKMGGQAVMEGIMMKGEEKTALAVRLPDESIRIRTEPTKTYGKWMKIPLVRGVIAFADSLVYGTKTLMASAEMLEEADDEEYEPGRFEAWLERRFGSRGVWNFMLYSSVILALAFTIGIFIILPTGAVNLMKHVTDSVFWLNFTEGVLRIALFVAYVWLVSYMPDIRRVFQYHGAEHKTIHAFENGLELTPENCRQFPTLHPRCGTSFLMFVFIIAFALHFLLGWPNLALRIVTRLLLLPVIAGVSYELLKWAGRSDNIVVKILSLPGLYLQKITTKEPDDSMLEVAIAAVNACMDGEPPGDKVIGGKAEEAGSAAGDADDDDVAAAGDADDANSADATGETADADADATGDDVAAVGDADAADTDATETDDAAEAAGDIEDEDENPDPRGSIPTE